MFLFSSEDSESSLSSSSSGDLAPNVSFVGEGTVFEGVLNVEGDLRVGGRVIGALDVAENVAVAEDGVVEGEIHATEAHIAGEVRGDVIVEDCLVLEQTAHVDGTVEAGRLVVEKGAVFVGECAMDRSEGDPGPSSDGVASDELTPEVQVSESLQSTPNGSPDGSADAEETEEKSADAS